MKTPFFTTLGALTVFLSGASAAEPSPDKGPLKGALEPGPLARMEALREKLALSDEQWEKLQPLLKQEGDKVREILADKTLSVDQKRAKAREVTAGGREQIKELLTSEQRQKLAAEMKVRPGAPAGDGGQRIAELKEKLGLSEEQAAKLSSLLAEEGPKLRALREDRNMTPEEKRSAFEASFGRISAELTAPQRDKLREEMRARRKE